MKNYGNYMNVYESMQLLHRAQVFFVSHDTKLLFSRFLIIT